MINPKSLIETFPTFSIYHTLLSLIIFGSLMITPTLSHPNKPVYLDAESRQLQQENFGEKAGKKTTQIPIRLAIKIEPPATSGLVIDKTQSYLQKISVEPQPFPHKDPEAAYIDTKGNRIDFSQWHDPKPFMKNFPFLFSQNDYFSLEKSPYHHGSKYYLESPANVRDKTKNSFLAKETFLFNVKPTQIYELNLVWFDAKQDQFFHSSLMINTFRIAQSIQKHIPDQLFENILISLHTNGSYTLWLGNPEFEIQIDREIFANKTDSIDWNHFQSSLFASYSQLSREEFTTAFNQQRSLPYMDEMFHMTDQDENPITNMRYKVVREDGKIYCGTTNRQGETKRIITGLHPYQVKLYYGTSCPNLY